MNTREQAIQLIEDITTCYGGCFSPEVLDFVRHYCAVDEYEMAFESLMLESIHTQIAYPPACKAKLHQVALRLGLHKESVFDSDFWQKLSRFLQSPIR